MKITQREWRSNCPINFALETFGDPWSLLIVRDILIFGKSTYGEFQKSEEGIATNILADRLVRLEREGIITRSVNESDRRKATFRLTQKGIDLLPVLLEIILWSVQHKSKTSAPKEFVEQIRNDRDGLTAKIIKELKSY